MVPGAGYYEHDQGYLITSCLGHLFGLAKSSTYDNVTPGFSFNHLPIIPKEWLFEQNQDTKKFVAIAKKALKRAKHVIHAGDADREGQLIVDELLRETGSTLPVKRLWLQGLDHTSIDRAFKSMKPNDDFRNLGEAALARSKADWLFGINFTQAFTLKFQDKLKTQSSKDKQVMPVGRVMSPTLSMIVKRNLAIENFKPVDFFQLQATFSSGSEQIACQLKTASLPEAVKVKQLDTTGRIHTKLFAESLKKKLSKAPNGMVTLLEKTSHSTPPPLGYSLSKLQKEASSKLAFGAQKTLSVAQALYEKHKLLSYPRVDCEYLPESQYADVQAILNNLVSIPLFANLIRSPSLKIKQSLIFNDKKITAHHAIIPTMEAPNIGLLSVDELNLYSLVVLNYIAQFYDNYDYEQTKLEVTLNPDDSESYPAIFSASGVVEKNIGWHKVLPVKSQKESLPVLAMNQALAIQGLSILDKKTDPPSHYTEGTLIEDMVNIQAMVTDPEIKKRLKETSGIGTDATRADIIGRLFENRLVEASGKKIMDTSQGRMLTQALPYAITDPGTTAMWETALDAISEGTLTADRFVSAQAAFVSQIVNEVKRTAAATS